MSVRGASTRGPRGLGTADSVERAPHRGPGAVAWLPRGRSWSGTAVGVVRRRREKESPRTRSRTGGASGQLRPTDSPGLPAAGDLPLSLLLPLTTC